MMNNVTVGTYIMTYGRRLFMSLENKQSRRRYYEMDRNMKSSSTKLNLSNEVIENDQLIDNLTLSYLFRNDETFSFTIMFYFRHFLNTYFSFFERLF